MLDQVKYIFIVGIKGTAMANVARILEQMGKQVSGSDVVEEFITDGILNTTGIKVTTSFAPEDLPQNTQLVIYSAAHGGKDNPQVQEAAKRGIKVLHQVEILAEIIKLYKTSVAVCGCHGKTTTSALLAHALKNLQVNPGHMVGTAGFGNSFGGEYGTQNYFVVEADEYGLNPPSDKTPKLNYLKPTDSICTNIDFDHPDVYNNIDEVKETFHKFFHKIITHYPGSHLFFCADDRNLMAVASTLPKTSYLTYGYTDQSDLQIIHTSNGEEQTNFKVKSKDGKIYEFSVSLFGEKNISNTAGVILFLLSKGFTAGEINKSLQGFTGAKRRFELVVRNSNFYLFDDYAHHPEEIEATIQAVRSRFPARRLVIIFQPHTYSRTESLKKEFVKSLSQADQVFIAPIFPSAREKSQTFSITSKDLENIAEEKNIPSIKGFMTKEELIQTLSRQLQKGDVLFTMGAGDIYKLKDALLTSISFRG